MKPEEILERLPTVQIGTKEYYSKAVVLNALKQCTLSEIDKQIKLLDKYDGYIVIQNELVELHKQRKEIEQL